jgi:hypothetical protein
VKGWIVWLLPPGDRRQATFRTHPLAPGVELVADGVVPLHAVTAEGRFTADVPMADPLPDWLFQAFSGRWRRTP